MMRRRSEKTGEPEKKGNCFQANGNYFQRKAVPGWQICHGLVINSIDQKPMVHCWIEYTRIHRIDNLKFKTAWVIDVSKSNKYNSAAELYYYFGSIDPELIMRYDLNQYLENIIEKGTYGPWDIYDNREPVPYISPLDKDIRENPG